MYKASPPPIFQPVPLPPVAPSYEPGGQEDRIERDEGHEDFAGSVRDLTQEAESSTNLANATQPSSEENGAQSEVSILFLPRLKIVLFTWTLQQSNTPGASSSGGGYDRQRNAEEKRHHFFLIFEALGASWDGNELSGLPISMSVLTRIGRGRLFTLHLSPSYWTPWGGSPSSGRGFDWSEPRLQEPKKEAEKEPVETPNIF